MYEYSTVFDKERQVSLVSQRRRIGLPAGWDRFTNAENVYNFCAQFLNIDKKTEEYVYCFCLDTKCRAMGFFEVSHGMADFCVCPPREIFQKALLAGAVSILLCHNHPSGDAEPSAPDRKLTKQMISAGRILNVPLMDHIIIGEGVYYSFQECENNLWEREDHA